MLPNLSIFLAFVCRERPGKIVEFVSQVGQVNIIAGQEDGPGIYTNIHVKRSYT